MEIITHPFVALITGKPLGRLVIQEYWYEGELIDPANVLFAEFDNNCCVRFFFDAGVFFWRLVSAPEVPESVDGHYWSLTDYGELGTATSVVLVESFTAAHLEIRLGNGRVLHLRNSEDRSRIEVNANDR